jgi:hypothetical protein
MTKYEKIWCCEDIVAGSDFTLEEIADHLEASAVRLRKMAADGVAVARRDYGPDGDLDPESDKAANSVCRYYLQTTDAKIANRYGMWETDDGEDDEGDDDEDDEGDDDDYRSVRGGSVLTANPPRTARSARE